MSLVNYSHLGKDKRSIKINRKKLKVFKNIVNSVEEKNKKKQKKV